MAPFENIKTFEFEHNDQSVRWQLQLNACFSFVRCPHPIFIKRFGHSNIILQCFDNMFEDVFPEDDDYQFFQALQDSAKNYPPANLRPDE